MRFDQDRFAAFDLNILQRAEAPAEYSESTQARAKQLHAAMTPADIDYLIKVIASALPGSTTEPLTIPQFRDRLQQYRGIDSAVLRQHLVEFLTRVTPVAEALGVRAENDLPAMAKRFGPRIGFAHLRATRREADGLSFFESDHLDGDVDMIAVLKGAAH